MVVSMKLSVAWCARLLTRHGVLQAAAQKALALHSLSLSPHKAAHVTRDGGTQRCPRFLLDVQDLDHIGVPNQIQLGSVVETGLCVF